MYVCPRCGAPQGSKKFIGPFCIDCYQFRINVPSAIEVKRCKRCGRILLSGKWIPYAESKLAAWVVRKFKGEFQKAEFFPETGEAVFHIEEGGARNEIRKQINFDLHDDICPDCNKQSGGYFEAIVQLRGNAERIEKYVRIFEERLAAEDSFISKIIVGKQGPDIYVGSTRAVMVIVKRLGLEHKISTTLAGQKQGKRLYRTTFSIRL